MHNIIGLIVVLLIADSSAMYSRTGLVVELTQWNFDSLVLYGGKNWVVMFYAPWCDHSQSQSMGFEYEKAARTLKGVVEFGAVDGDANQSLRDRYDVRGYPTIKIFGANKAFPIDFNGQRTASALIEAVMRTVSQKEPCDTPPKNGISGDNNDIFLIDINDMVLHKDDPELIMDIYPPPCEMPMPCGPRSLGKAKARAQEGDVEEYPTTTSFPGSSDDVDNDGGSTSS